VFGSELLGVIVTQILVLKSRADLSSFKPKGNDPGGFGTAVAARLDCRVKKLNCGGRVRQCHYIIVYLRHQNMLDQSRAGSAKDVWIGLTVCFTATPS